MAEHQGRRYILVDLPGTYSLLAHSAEEEVARDFLCFGKPDCTIVVVDATCLERNLNLVLQTTEITNRVVVCVNLIDEAEKKGLHIDLDALSQALGVPCVPCAARAGRGLPALMEQVRAVADGLRLCKPPRIRYPAPIEKAAALIEEALPERLSLSRRWLSLRLLEADEAFTQTLADAVSLPLPYDRIKAAREQLSQAGQKQVQDQIVSGLILHAEEIALTALTDAPPEYLARDRKLDRLLTSRRTGFPIMLLLLAVVFFLTISGANVPSAMLSDFLFSFQEPLFSLLAFFHTPLWLQSLLIDGVYCVLAWVITTICCTLDTCRASQPSVKEIPHWTNCFMLSSVVIS